MPTINQLPSIDEVSGGNQIPTYYAGGGDARKMSVNLLQDYLQDNLDFPDNASEITYNPAGTSAVARTVESKLRDVVSVKDFGAVGNGVADDTAALQAFLNACKNGRGYIPKGTYKITSALSVDPRFSYNIEGDSWDNSNNGGGATRIQNAGTGHAIEVINSPFTQNYDKQIRFANLNVEGTASSRNGFHVIQAQVYLENIWVTNTGWHGIYLEKAYSSSFKQVICAQNYQHGCYVYRAGNALHFDHCVFNGNSRTDGYSGAHVSGSANQENLGVTFTSCDFTSNGYPAGVTTAFGVVIQHTWGAALIGCYAEGNKLRNLYADSTARGLTVQNGYWQDGVNEIADAFGLVYENNVHQYIGTATQALISGSTSARRLTRVHGNTVAGGATQTYSTGIKQRSEIYANAIPTTGTWEVGDIVWYSAVDWGLPIGWVCTAAGTPGTWRPISERVPGTFANWGDSGATLSPLGSLGTNVWASPLTADRAVTLSTTNAFSGCKFRITRTAGSTGAFNLNVGSGPLKALAAGQWCDVEFDGTNWILTASGSL